MSVAIKIKDETAAGDLVAETVVTFPAQKITAKELIQGRVAEEVRKYNEKQTGLFQGLIQPTASEVELNGFKLKRGKPVNVAKQQEIALQAFGSNGFFLLVNDKQVSDLDQIITITPNTSVAFVKLVPLVGG